MFNLHRDLSNMAWSPKNQNFGNDISGRLCYSHLIESVDFSVLKFGIRNPGFTWVRTPTAGNSCERLEQEISEEEEEEEEEEQQQQLKKWRK